MEDMATGEIRLSIVWEWLHKGGGVHGGRSGHRRPHRRSAHAGRCSTGCCARSTRSCWPRPATRRARRRPRRRRCRSPARSSRSTSTSTAKLPWYIDLLNLNLDNQRSRRGAAADRRLPAAFAAGDSAAMRAVDRSRLVVGSLGVGALAGRDAPLAHAPELIDARQRPCALSRDARIGLPATMTVTGFVCSCGKLPDGNPAAALDGDRHFDRVVAAVRRHFAARHDASVDHHFDEALLALVQRIGFCCSRIRTVSPT